MNHSPFFVDYLVNEEVQQNGSTEYPFSSIAAAVQHSKVGDRLHFVNTEVVLELM